jgi:hypothetical protein
MAAGTVLSVRPGGPRLELTDDLTEKGKTPEGRETLLDGKCKRVLTFPVEKP